MANIRKLQSVSRTTVQQGGNSTTITTLSFAPNGPGTFLIVFGGAADAGATLSITDTRSHSWTPLTGPVASGTDVTFSWYTTTTTSLPMTITVTKDLLAQFMNVMVDEFMGVDNYDPISDYNGGLTGTGTPTTAVIPQDNRTMLWGACNDTITAPGTGFTTGCNDGSSDFTEWKLLGDSTAGVSQTVDFAGSGTFNLLAVALKPAPSCPRRNSLRPYLFGPGNAK